MLLILCFVLFFVCSGSSHSASGTTTTTTRTLSVEGAHITLDIAMEGVPREAADSVVVSIIESIPHGAIFDRYAAERGGVEVASTETPSPLDHPQYLELPATSVLSLYTNPAVVNLTFPPGANTVYKLQNRYQRFGAGAEVCLGSTEVQIRCGAGGGGAACRQWLGSAVKVKVEHLPPICWDAATLTEADAATLKATAGKTTSAAVWCAAVVVAAVSCILG